MECQCPQPAWCLVAADHRCSREQAAIPEVRGMRCMVPDTDRTVSLRAALLRGSLSNPCPSQTFCRVGPIDPNARSIPSFKIEKTRFALTLVTKGRLNLVTSKTCSLLMSDTLAGNAVERGRVPSVNGGRPTD